MADLVPTAENDALRDRLFRLLYDFNYRDMASGSARDCEAIADTLIAAGCVIPPATTEADQ